MVTLSTIVAGFTPMSTDGMPLLINVSAQVIRDEKRNLFLLINDIPITQWFREQYSNKLEKKSGLHILQKRPQNKRFLGSLTFLYLEENKSNGYEKCWDNLMLICSH